MRLGARIASPVYLAVIYAFLFFPAILVVIFSFNSSRFWAFPLRGFTWRWYEQLLSRPEVIDAARNSLTVACVTVLTSVSLGAAASVALNNWSFRGKSLLESILLTPLLVPSLIWAIALLLFLTFFGARLGMASVILGHILYTIPFTVLLASTRLRSLDPNLEDAARSLGARRFYIFRRIVLPHLAPALIAAALMTFAISFSDLVIAFFLGGGGFNTLPVFIYSLIQFEPTPMINAISSIIFAVGVVCVLIALLAAGRDVVTVREEGPRGRS